MRVRERNLGKGLTYTLAVMVFTVFMVLIVLPKTLGSVTTRPEGAVFHFLYEGVGKDDAGFMEDYGDPALAGSVRQFERHDDGDWFERVEVGRATVAGDVARVPALVVRRDTEDSDARTKGLVTAVVRKTDDQWKVVELVARDPGTLVPSEGGDHPARAPKTAWLAAFGIGLLLTLLAELVLRTAPDPGKPQLRPTGIAG